MTDMLKFLVTKSCPLLILFALTIITGTCAFAFTVRQTAPQPVNPNEAEHWPYWDGLETPEAYAKRAGLQAEISISLGNGSSIELKLIPAGSYVMGTSQPRRTNVSGAVAQEAMWSALSIGLVGLFLALFSTATVMAFKSRKTLQLSIIRLVFYSLVLGAALLSCMQLRTVKASLKYSLALREKEELRYKTGSANEKPAHKVIITKPFYLSKYSITRDQYLTVLNIEGRAPMDYSFPIDSISWDDAKLFCERLSIRSGANVRLPYEAEWEYACRSGTDTLYYSGDSESDLNLIAWHKGNSFSSLHPVGQKAPNPWGLYDMVGNSWQWCEDWYGEGYYASSPAVDPTGPTSGEKKVLRGGSWCFGPWACRSAFRISSDPSTRTLSDGLRIVVTIDSSKL